MEKWFVDHSIYLVDHQSQTLDQSKLPVVIQPHRLSQTLLFFGSPSVEPQWGPSHGRWWGPRPDIKLRDEV